MQRLVQALCGGVLVFCSQASAVELFVKGTASKSFLSSDEFVASASGAAGLAINLLPRVRLEGRYTFVTSQRNKMDLTIDSTNLTLSNITTQTNVYSLALEVDVLSDRSAFQPYVALGAGYLSKDRSYSIAQTGSSTSQSVTEPRWLGISANAGLGFKIRLARQVALEFEVFGYGIDVYKPNAQVDWDAKTGLRLIL